jgi:hypothetical protein
VLRTISISTSGACGATGGDHAGGAGAGRPAQGRGRGSAARECGDALGAAAKTGFAIEIERCPGCGGRLEVIASIEEAALIERILEHLRQRAQEDQGPLPLGARAPPPPLR